jgi:hypothetical protein
MAIDLEKLELRVSQYNLAMYRYELYDNSCTFPVAVAYVLPYGTQSSKNAALLLNINVNAPFKRLKIGTFLHGVLAKDFALMLTNESTPDGKAFCDKMGYIYDDKIDGYVWTRG